MKLSQSNFNLQSSDCYLVRSYLIATVNLVFTFEHFVQWIMTRVIFIQNYSIVFWPATSQPN